MSLKQQHGLLFKLAKITKRLLYDNLSEEETEDLQSKQQELIDLLDKNWPGWETR
jgi:hypothetical protein